MVKEFKVKNGLIDRLEDILTLRNEKLMESIDEAREEVKRREVYTFEEVFKDID